MIRLYRILSSLLYGLVYLFGRFKASHGDELWRERLALATYNTPVDLWIHAASVGEVRVVNCLVSYLLGEKPDLKIHLTVMTRTGCQTARTLFGPEVNVSYLPLDVPRLMKRKLQAVRPRLLVIAETEIWPNLILESSRAGVPIILVNGRLSDRAVRQYQLLKNSFQSLLARYERIFVKSEADRDRFLKFLPDDIRLVVAGDMKFDAPLHKRDEEKRKRTRESLGIGSGEFLFVAGSTREGEEAALFGLAASLISAFPHFRLVIAPRHVERAAQVEELARQAGLKSRRVGEAQSEPASSDIIIVDRMGMLNDLYLASELAFVGGTLVDIGGHNILEPVWAGTPVLFGPSVANVADAARYIEEHNYGSMIHSAEELRTRIEGVLSGKISYAVKTDSDENHSATTLTGTYLLDRLRNA